MNRLALCCALALATISLPVHAQYQWRDPAGRMVFSDQPPPAGTPASRIVRAPAPPASVGTPALSAGARPADQAAGPAAPPGGTRPGYKERLMASEKARAQAREQTAEAEKQAAEKRKQAKYCDELRAERITLESGIRIARVDARGERGFVDDAERQRRLSANSAALGEHCQP